VTSALLVVRLAIVVGNNHGLIGDVPLRFAEADAQKVAHALVDLGGFSADEVHVVLAATPEALRARLAQLQPAGDGEVLFYFSGHADPRRLHMAGGTLDLDELRAAVERTGGALRIFVVDACNSGAFVRDKGATKGASFDLSLAQPDPHARGTITITSSSADEIAQESDRLEGSFFTHYWVAGLYGAADANGDGLVTLEEAYHYAHHQTLARTIESRGGVQHPSFRLQIAGQGDVVLAHLARASARLELVPGDAPGQYFILDAPGQLVLMEAPGAAAVRLPPGRYRVRKREAGRLLVGEVALVSGQTVTLRDADMKASAYAGQTAKGGLPFGLDAHGPHVSVGARNGIAPGMGPTSTFLLGYRLRWGSFFAEPRSVVRSAQIDVSGGGNRQYAELDLGGALGLRWRGDRWGGGIAVDSGLVIFDQDALAVTQSSMGSTSSSSPSGFLPVAWEGGLLGAIEYFISPRFGVTLEPHVGIAAFRLGGQLTGSFIAGGSVGFDYEFR
jgi:Caspase domain